MSFFDLKAEKTEARQKNVMLPLLEYDQMDEVLDLEGRLSSNLKRMIKYNELLFQKKMLHQPDDNIECSEIIHKGSDLLKTTTTDLKTYSQHCHKDSRMNNKLRRFSELLTDQTNKFTSLSHEILNRSRGMTKQATISSTRNHPYSSHTDPENDLESPSHTQDSTTNSQIQDQIISKDAIFLSELMSDRQQEIESLTKCVHEINDLLVESSQIVTDQGIMIDRMDDNLESSKRHTKKTVHEVTKAGEYQKRAIRKQWTCVAIVVVVVVTVVAMLYAAYGY